MVSNGWFRLVGQLSYLSKKIMEVKKVKVFTYMGNGKENTSANVFLLLNSKHFPNSFLVNLTRALTRIRRCFAHLQIPRELSYPFLHQF